VLGGCCRTEGPGRGVASALQRGAAAEGLAGACRSRERAPRAPPTRTLERHGPEYVDGPVRGYSPSIVPSLSHGPHPLPGV